jgi:hypothetical protein
MAILNSPWIGRPKLKGQVEKIDFTSRPSEIIAGGPSGWLCAFVGVANVHSQPTTVSRCQLRVSFADGVKRELEAELRGAEFWDATVESHQPADKRSLSLDAKFELNVHHRGWLYFPCEDFGDVADATVLLRDARGKRHKLKWA